MSILGRLGFKAKPSLPSSELAVVRRLGEALEQLPPERARWVGSFALMLARVANADLRIVEEEVRRMEELVQEHAGATPGEAALIVEIAKVQHRLFGGSDDYLASRELRNQSTRDERLRLLDALFAVSAADDQVTTVEEEVIRKIAAELGLTHDDYIAARLVVRDKRTILKPP